MRIETVNHNVSPQDLPDDLRGRIAWEFIYFSIASCRDKDAAIELALSSADEVIERVRGLGR